MMNEWIFAGYLWQIICSTPCFTKFVVLATCTAKQPSSARFCSKCCAIPRVSISWFMKNLPRYLVVSENWGIPKIIKMDHFFTGKLIVWGFEVAKFRETPGCSGGRWIKQRHVLLQDIHNLLARSANMWWRCTKTHIQVAVSLRKSALQSEPRPTGFWASLHHL
jgi:hypothetical protein